MSRVGFGCHLIDFQEHTIYLRDSEGIVEDLGSDMNLRSLPDLENFVDCLYRSGEFGPMRKNKLKREIRKRKNCSQECLTKK